MKSESEQKLGCDTADMLMIHRLFRWLFGDAPGLVRGVAAGDTARAEVVGAHIEQIVAGLHLHHQGEDLLLWDLLESRAPACALHVGQMRTQHQACGSPRNVEGFSMRHPEQEPRILHN